MTPPPLRTTRLRQQLSFAQQGYVAGWGRTKHSASGCTTDGNGPKPYSNCKFPFKWKGQVLTETDHSQWCVLRGTLARSFVCLKCNSLLRNTDHCECCLKDRLLVDNFKHGFMNVNFGDSVF